ncbi:ImmA/IrrE family metallo-endopeptidase [Methylobacterium sp. Leaf117]|uniref:ImmA/IrrE family metallo-endopeptidase n=1 Tax=Methylobacterium sp. Leaf117 TaxID=1736260 RepID=UPI0009E9E00D|nr:ImmA/IrrE family metallo-endopeptidase [Methylobacterium sp. Leaf117]
MSAEDCWVDSRSNQVVKELAKRAREDLQQGEKIPVDVVACLQRGNVTTVVGRKRLEYRIIDDAEMDGDDGNTRMDDDVIIVSVRRSIHQKALWGEGRARMTLAHELGHAVMHPGMAKARRSGATGRSVANSIPAHKSAEHQAKVFASAFLIVQSYAETLGSSEEISEQFSISLEASEIAFADVAAERNKRESFSIVRNLADQFIREASAKPAQQMSFLKDLCPHCGQQKLAPIGVKYHCYNCGSTSDAFQDGDRHS